VSSCRFWICNCTKFDSNLFCNNLLLDWVWWCMNDYTVAWFNEWQCELHSSPGVLWVHRLSRFLMAARKSQSVTVQQQRYTLWQRNVVVRLAAAQTQLADHTTPHHTSFMMLSSPRDANITSLRCFDVVASSLSQRGTCRRASARPSDFTFAYS